MGLTNAVDDLFELGVAVALPVGHVAEVLHEGRRTRRQPMLGRRVEPRVAEAVEVVRRAASL